MNFLSEQDIYTNCEIIKEEIETDVSFEDGYALAKYLQRLSSYLGTISFSHSSSVYNYQTKKTPESVALKKYAEEISDKINKRISSIQTILNQLKAETFNSKYQK